MSLIDEVREALNNTPIGNHGQVETTKLRKLASRLDGMAIVPTPTIKVVRQFADSYALKGDKIAAEVAWLLAAVEDK